jgi:hypothetical protein
VSVKLAVPVVRVVLADPVAALAARLVRTARVLRAPVTVVRLAAAADMPAAAADPGRHLVQVGSVPPRVASIALPAVADTVPAAEGLVVVAARVIAIVKARPWIARRSGATTTTATRPRVA